MNPGQLRRRRLNHRLKDLKLDALVVSSPPNLRCLTGFSGEGLLLAGPQARLVTDHRYELAARRQAPGCRLVSRQRGHLSTLIELLSRSGYERVGFEAGSMTCAQLRTLRRQVKGARFVPTEGLVEELRRRKDAGEIELLARAARITDQVVQQVLEGLRPGRTEWELAWELRTAFALGHGVEAAFPPIVASGPNSALPHAEPTDRRLRRGDVLTLDLGARLEGYCADLTRTVCVGRPPAGFKARYLALRQAQKAALEVIAPGVPTSRADAAARSVLRAAGLDQAFTHSLGHGVGLEVHEAPRLAASGSDCFEVGQVFTVEPGVYFEDWGGLRVEDLFVLEQDGPRRLSHAPRLYED